LPGVLPLLRDVDGVELDRDAEIEPDAAHRVREIVERVQRVGSRPTR
jgi:hypothetical protein